MYGSKWVLELVARTLRSRAWARTAKYVTAMSQRSGAPTIRFDATLYTIDGWTILRLPEKASRKLPSRGQVAVQGTIDGHKFQTVLDRRRDRSWASNRRCREHERRAGGLRERDERYVWGRPVQRERLAG